VAETQEFRESYSKVATDPGDLNIISTPIVCYRGKADMKMTGTHFVDKDPSKCFHLTCGIRSSLNGQSGMYSLLCFVRGDLSRVPKLPRASSFSREKYYAATFDVVLSLGLTETKAHVCWMENVRSNLWDTRYYPDLRFSFVGRRKEVRLLR
jgi:hypothetical protein